MKRNMVTTMGQVTARTARTAMTPRMWAFAVLICAPMIATVDLAAQPAAVQWSRPGPRLPAPAVLATGLERGQHLFADGDTWLVATDDGKLLRVDPKTATTTLRSDVPVAVAGVPISVRLLRSGATFYSTVAHGTVVDGKLQGPASGSFVRLDDGKLTELIAARPGLRGATIASDAIWWLEDDTWKTTDESGEAIDAPGSALYKASLAGGAPALVKGAMGPFDAIHVRVKDILVGWSGDEPRGIWRLDPVAGSLALIAESRFFSREFVQVDTTLYVLMNQGNGWIQRLDETASAAMALGFDFVETGGGVIAPGGSRRVQLADGSLYWLASGAIMRWPLPTGEPTAVALDTRPADLVVAAGKLTWLEKRRGQLLQLPLPAK